MGEKTEKATPKKLEDARKKGQVARSQDIPAVATFIASMTLTLMLMPNIYSNITSFFHRMMDRIPKGPLEDQANEMIIDAIATILYSSVPIVVAVAGVGAIVNFVMIGPLFTFEVFKFDIKKFDPVSNLKQKFKLKTLIELLKSLFKILGAAYICFGVVQFAIPIVVQTAGHDIWVLTALIAHFLKLVLIRVGLFFLAVALLDLLYQKHNFDKEMMMEKFEVKQEYKNMEGDPEIKSKRRETAREIAYGGTPSPQHAKAVVTNPTHIAVAIGYDKEKFAAPFVITKGTGNDAKWIIREAERLDIPVMRNVSLAHLLYEETELYHFVPVASYEAIAELLRWVAEVTGEEL